MCGATRKHGSLRGYCREACPISSGKNSFFFMQHIKYEFNNLLFQYIFKYSRGCSYVTKTYVNWISFNFGAFSLQQLCFANSTLR